MGRWLLYNFTTQNNQLIELVGDNVFYRFLTVKLDLNRTNLMIQEYTDIGTDCDK